MQKSRRIPATSGQTLHRPGRFLALTACLILAVLLVGIAAYTRLRAIENAAIHLTEDPLKCAYLIGKLQSNAIFQFSLLTDHVNTDDQAEKARLESRIDGAKNGITGVMREYQKLLDAAEDRRLFAVVQSLREPYNECYLQVLRLSQKGNRKGALNCLRPGWYPCETRFSRPPKPRSFGTSPIPMRLPPQCRRRSTDLKYRAALFELLCLPDRNRLDDRPTPAATAGSSQGPGAIPGSLRACSVRARGYRLRPSFHPRQPGTLQDCGIQRRGNAGRQLARPASP